MSDETYIIIILAVWALSATVMCVYLTCINEDKEAENYKLRLQRNFFKNHCEKHSENKIKNL